MKRPPKPANFVVLENDDPIIAENEALQEKIRYRAWELSHTRPHDAHAQYDWLKAQYEIVSVPPVRVVEKSGMFDIKFAVSGVNPDDINVMVTPNRVMLKAESAEEESSEEGIVHISDFRTATVFRLVKLPAPIDPKTVTVDFEDGVIHMTAAKESAAVAPSKRTASPRKAPARKSRAKLP
jgi:HSP20 family molecular chaperone IbpA